MVRPPIALCAFCALALTACGSTEDSSQNTGVGGAMNGAGGGNGTLGSGGQTTSTGSGGVSQVGGASLGGQSSTSGGSATGGTAMGGATSNGGSSTGGAVGVGGKSSTGGSSTGGAKATGGAATGGKASGGTTSTGGKATGGTATGGTGTGGAATGGTGTGGGATGGSSSTLPKFSFFVTSDAALIALSGNANGFGGDLRYGEATGLAGADKICAAIAERSMPGSSVKQWRAFLSIAANGSEPATNAIDRVGSGPWYDRQGRVVALTKAALAATRPQGADSLILNDLPNENGIPNHAPDGTQIDNHDTLTGSTEAGLLASNYANTCNNWTSSAASGKPVIGHSWIAFSGNHWIRVGHTAGGCAPGRTIGTQGGQGTTVGSMGGYGGFYCFALTP